MKLWTVVTVSFLVLQDALAQTPPGFVPKVEANLLAVFEQSNISIKLGNLIPLVGTTSVSRIKALLTQNRDTNTMPLLTAPANVSSSSLYLAFMIDSDVPFNSSLTTLLHWFQPNLLATDGILSANERNVNASHAVGASYTPPQPPPGSGAHEYTLLLFEQPWRFIVPKQFSSINPPASLADRIGFNISEFISASGLTNPISANFFRALNGTVSQTSGVESSIAAASTSVSMNVGSMSFSSVTAVTGTISGATSQSVTATSTIISATGASSPSVSASATQSSIAGLVNVKSREREVLASLALVILSAPMWMA